MEGNVKKLKEKRVKFYSSFEPIAVHFDESRKYINNFLLINIF